MSARRVFLWMAGATAVAGAVQCRQSSEETVLECSASGVHHILRIRPGARQADDLAVQPATHGEAAVSDAEYVLRFVDSRDHYEVRFRIDRVSGSGTRELFDDEQQAIRGEGGFDRITCRPYRAST
jgi:hypothetical protein